MSDYNKQAAKIEQLEKRLAERSAEYLAAHITYDKGYQAGRQDAEDAKYDEDEVLAEIARYQGNVEQLHTKLAKLNKKSCSATIY